MREKIELRQAIVETETSEFEKMVEEAVVLHKAGRFEAAVEKNIDLVACLEANAKKGSTAVNAEVHAMAVHNLGSALHQTGQFDVAKAFYSEAVTELSTAEQGPLDFILKMFGDVRGAQVRRRVAYARVGVPRTAGALWSRNAHKMPTCPSFIARASSRRRRRLLHPRSTLALAPRPPSCSRPSRARSLLAPARPSLLRRAARVHEAQDLAGHLEDHPQGDGLPQRQR